MKYDYLIVGAGFSGLVAAERLCNQHGKKCLLVEKRDHIGGNAHDCYDSNGVLIHPYGPHYFRTNSDEILEYLSRFTDWIPGNYKVKVFSEGRLWSFPINLETFEQYTGQQSTPEEMLAWLVEQRVDFERINNSEEAVLSEVGEKWFKLFFEGYTLKQWKRHPRELSPSVCRRIPVRTTKNDRYFNDKHQLLPKHGYHTLFDNLVQSCGERLELSLKTDFKELLASKSIKWEHLIYTGPIDAYFDYKFGPLPYRSLRFEREHFSAEQLEQGAVGKEVEANIRPFHSAQQAQPCVQVNYPSEATPYTRTVEAKHITGQQVDGTTIVKEFPEDYEVGKEPYYPIPAVDARELYKRYADEAEKLDKVSFLGRLGTYQYYNMDQVVGMALKFVERLA